MHQLRVHLSTGDGEIAHRKPVDFKRRERFLLSDVDLIIGRSIEHNCRVILRESLLDLRAIGDVDLGALEARDLIFASGKYRFEFDAQLSATTKNRDSLHVSIMTRLSLLATVRQDFAVHLHAS
jgi:hypothetical protein